MTKLKNTKKTSETEVPQHGCEFCGRTFARESTIMKHICEYKHRYLEKDRAGNRIGFQAWLQFYRKNSTSTKHRTYEEFIKSAYYTAFVKFGNYCVEINAVNISRFADWLLKNQIKIDTWCTDTTYTKYLIEYLKVEDPLDAIARSVETTMTLAETAGILSKDVLRYGNTNRICHSITTGKISPWMLYHSTSGTQFLGNLNEPQVDMIIDYINPEQWKIKFNREPENVKQVKELLTIAGY
jgi:hypothetical protein